VCVYGAECVFSWHCKTQTQNFHSGRAPRVDFSQPLGATSPTSAPLHPLSAPIHTHTQRHTHTHTHTHTQTWPQSAPCSLTCYFRFRIRFVCCRRRNLTKSHVANASSSRSLAKKALRASIRSIRVIVPLVGILRASSRPAIGSRWQHPFSCWLSCEFSFGAFGGGEQLHLCISHRTFIVIPSARSCCFVLVFVAKFRGIFS